ncbi:hypothetical protein H5410_061872 [Solanum commersonii]|uniref:Uncharacterized protein n=1 Tax=Solanum commersonii TaxID=4109 RepID=A0A9J5W975_SOLCO|nr:hypothetical protein H5410_061872 [Solanum commersonii]
MKAFIKVEAEHFASIRFNSWRKKKRLYMHIEQSIQAAFVKLSYQTKLEHKICLKVSVEVARLLLNQGFAFHGHREDESSLIKVVKKRLQDLRNEEWNPLVGNVSTFCGKYDILIPNFDEFYVNFERSRRKVVEYTILHHYRVEVCFKIIDWQLQEVNDHFNEVRTDLLIEVACLNPIESFSSFDIKNILRMAELYPDDFGKNVMVTLRNQIETYIVDVRDVDRRFSNLKRLGDISEKLVKVKKHLNYSLVFRLIKFVLLIATATVERAFFGNEVDQE